MNLRGILGAVLGGALGAALWGLASGGPGGMEGGYIPMIVGVLTAAGCLLFGGRGMKMALVAGAISVMAMLGGRVFGAWVVLNRDWSDQEHRRLEKQIKQVIDVDQETHNLLDCAEEFGRVSGDDECKRFIINRNFERGKSDGVVSQEEFDEFQAYWAPLLKKWSERKPGFGHAYEEVMAAEVQQTEAYYKANTPLWHIAKPDMDLLDLLFAIIGLFAAIGIVETVSEKLHLKRQAAEHKAWQMANRKPIPKVSPSAKLKVRTPGPRPSN